MRASGQTQGLSVVQRRLIIQITAALWSQESEDVRTTCSWIRLRNSDLSAKHRVMFPQNISPIFTCCWYKFLMLGKYLAVFLLESCTLTSWAKRRTRVQSFWAYILWMSLVVFALPEQVGQIQSFLSLVFRNSLNRRNHIPDPIQSFQKDLGRVHMWF